MITYERVPYVGQSGKQPQKRGVAWFLLACRDIGLKSFVMNSRGHDGASRTLFMVWHPYFALGITVFLRPWKFEEGRWPSK